MGTFYNADGTPVPKAIRLIRCPEMLERFKRVAVLDYRNDSKTNFIASCLDVHNKSKEPVIIVDNNELTISSIFNKCQKFSRDISDIYKSYYNIQSLKNLDNTVNCYRINDGGIHLALEHAMHANKFFVDAGYKPLLIINEFDQLFLDDYDESLIDFVNEVYFSNISSEQNIVILSDLLVIDEDEPAFEETSQKFVNSLDNIIIMPGYLYDGWDYSDDREKSIIRMFEILDDNVVAASLVKKFIEYSAGLSSSYIYNLKTGGINSLGLSEYF